MQRKEGHVQLELFARTIIIFRWQTYRIWPPVSAIPTSITQNRIFIEKLTVAHLLKKFPIFQGTPRVTGSSPEPPKTIPHPHIVFI
jgi:hypothetical protein